jgi:transposase-like protein
MRRRKFSPEFKLEAVNLVKNRGVSIMQASRDLELNHNVLLRWLKELGADLSLEKQVLQDTVQGNLEVLNGAGRLLRQAIPH